ncbi:MAG: class 1 fructose-bisphosphatase [Parvularculaceae bacterium]
MTGTSLRMHLDNWAGGDAGRHTVAQTVASLARVAAVLSEKIGRADIDGDGAAIVGENADGDQQKALDVEAHELFTAALKAVPVREIWSEEEDGPIECRTDGGVIVAIDPLDGSSNIDTNLSVGTIFSILPAPVSDADKRVLPPGTAQLAAGFFIYGPATSLALTLREGVSIFTLDRKKEDFIRTQKNLKISERKPEYAINASNYRHWDEPIRAYIDDCIVGIHGPREENFNMRWIASLVAEAYRILMRGGIFLYPRDRRQGYGSGRLRLVYEANPIALLMEQAGAAATDTVNRVLEIQPTEIHQRTPFVFGSKRMVERVKNYHLDLSLDASRQPLFGNRGLFRK